MDRTRKSILAICIMFALVHSFNALSNAYMPLFLEDIGFQASQRGILLSIGPLISVAVQNIWGPLADRSETKNRIMRILALGVALTAFVFLFTASDTVKSLNASLTGIFPLTLILTIISLTLYSSFQPPMLPMIDTMAMEYIDESKADVKYGTIRMVGTLSYVIVSYITGIIIDRSSMGTTVIFVEYAFFATSLFFALGLVPRIRGTAKGRKQKESYLTLFRDKWFTVLAVGAFLVSISYGFNISNFTNYLRDELGAPGSVIGISTALGSTLEVFLFLVVHKIAKKTGILNLILLCISISTLRWFINSITTSIPVLIAVQFFTQPFSWAILVYAIAIYIQKAIPSYLHARGQAMINILMASIAKVIGTLVGGFIIGKTGLSGMRYIYLAMFILNLSTLAFVTISFRRFGWGIKKTPKELEINDNTVI